MGYRRLSPHAAVSAVKLAVRTYNRYSRSNSSDADLMTLLTGSETEESPRSLSGCDTLLMPQILQDFPDFDANHAKILVKDYLAAQLSGKPGLLIHNVVIARYLPSSAQKTILFQAAVSWMENGRRVQKRFELHYTYLLTGSDGVIAANCPNCGGALGYGVTVCPYCDSRVASVMGNVWQFTHLEET